MTAASVSEEILIASPPERLWPLVTEARHFQVWYAFGGPRSIFGPAARGSSIDI